jgi:rhamnulose-1-phosphate aldolase
MNNIFDAPFVKEMRETTANMYRLGWDERNGGNISCLLDASMAEAYLDPGAVLRTLPLDFDASFLGGRYLIVTATGKYFKNVKDCPQDNMGVIRIRPDGRSYDILWGFADGSRPTSELATHLMNHIERLKADPAHRVVMHCHPLNILAMTFVHELDERAFTRTLWRMCTECIVVFPEGIGVLPWMVCGNNEIGLATAAKIRDHRIVLWAAHGIFGTGESMDEAFGLIETVEKAAQVYMTIGTLPVRQSITDAQLRALCDAFGIRPRDGYLDET